MKEIFNEEFKAFLKKDPMQKYDIGSKALQDLVNRDPRFNPVIVKQNPCPHMWDIGDPDKYCGFGCDSGVIEDVCEGPDNCHIMKKDK